MQARIEALESRLVGMQVGTAQEGLETAIEGQPVTELRTTHDERAPKIAVQGIVGADSDEPNENLTPILSKILIQPAKPVKEVIADLVAGGMRSQTEIAKRINQLGYRTSKGTEYHLGQGYSAGLYCQYQIRVAIIDVS